MLYTKIKVEDYSYPKRLYRVLAIKGNPKLSKLGAIIGSSVEASFEHYYLFHCKDRQYVASSWLNQFPSIIKQYSMSTHFMSDLDESFVYEYDTGEGYEFKCKIYKNKIEMTNEELDEEEMPEAYILEGKGAGIFEDNHYMMDEYLEGNISPEFCEDDEDIDRHLWMPFNLDIEKLSDFDNPLDLEYCNELIDDVDYIAKHFDDEELESYQFNDDEDEEEIDEFLLKEEVAYDIFNEEEINKVFRQMSKMLDINEIYEIFVEAYKQIEEKFMEGEHTHNEFVKEVIKEIKKYTKN